MTPDEVYSIWAPPESPWSVWAKPILFAHLAPLPGVEASSPRPTLQPAVLPPLPAPAGEMALVIDLPGVEAIAMGLAAAASGFRPVPLFNAAPGPRHASRLRAGSIVSVWPIAEALLAMTDELARLAPPASAPPAFLLDSARRGQTGARPQAGLFDNRSVSLPTDFPSAAVLHAHDIRHVLLIQRSGQPQADLAHTLLRWQEGGIQLWTVATESPGSSPRLLRVSRPSGFRAWWHNLLAQLGLHRHPFGGFGGMLPESGSGG